MKNNEKKNWFEGAIYFDAHLVSKAPEILKIRDLLYEEIESEINPVRSKTRYKVALRSILLNLLVGWYLGRPVKYSRNVSDYSHHKRYGKLFFKPRRILPAIDALEKLGYVGQKPGFYDRKQGIGRQSRMWATERLIGLFKFYKANRPGLISRSQPEELIQLKDKKKKAIDYDKTPERDNMRKSVSNYNNFISEQNITVELNKDSEVNINYLTKLYTGEITGAVENIVVNSYNNYIDNNYNNTNTNTSSTSTTYSMTNTIRNVYNIVYSNDAENYHNIPSWYVIDLDYYINNVLSWCRTNTLYAYMDYSDFFKEMRSLSYYRIENISYSINYSYLHRVFNRGSFEEGGRFWGAYHMEMPRDLRQHIKINGQPTTELDYKAMHVRMLYHQEGNDYQDDPYLALASNDEERLAYKLSTLVILNASNVVKAYYGVKNIFQKEGIEMSTSQESIQSMIDSFRAEHPDISHHLCSGVGRTLMNLDSKICEGIITQLTDDGIPCLPVHDSFIVPVQHEDVLRQAMTEEYKDVMGFNPIIDKKH